MYSPLRAAMRSRQIRVRVSDQLFGRIRDHSREREVTVSAGTRFLIVQGLASATGDGGQADLAVFACLVAAEHVRLLLEGIAPDGRSRSQQLRGPAVAAAELRLVDLSEGLRR